MVCDGCCVVCVVYVLLFVACSFVGCLCLLRVQWLLFVVCCMSGVGCVRCLVIDDRCVLFVACHALRGVRCSLLVVVCRVLFVGL